MKSQTLVLAIFLLSWLPGYVDAADYTKGADETDPSTAFIMFYTGNVFGELEACG